VWTQVGRNCPKKECNRWRDGERVQARRTASEVVRAGSVRLPPRPSLAERPNAPQRLVA